VRLAFVALLQRLPGRQRAALVLRDVPGMSAQETAQVLEVSVAAVNSAVQRARAAIGPRPDAADADDGRAQRVADRYAAAWERGDVDGIVALLAPDVRYAMPPLPEWYAGDDAVRAFLLDGPLTERWRFRPARANGQIAFGTYSWDAERDRWVAAAVDLLSVRDGAVHEVVSFLGAEHFPRLGCPVLLPPDRWIEVLCRVVRGGRATTSTGGPRDRGRAADPGDDRALGGGGARRRPRHRARPTGPVTS
jgi:RNA polymerase sigma-70 factor (ECF subfamily)